VVIGVEDDLGQDHPARDLVRRRRSEEYDDDTDQR
jgi:hypothetical protein